jgi:predicted O-methyltransferase YrrM
MVHPVDPYCTHFPFLAWAVVNSRGPILELGAGLYSTPLIHALAGDRQVVSLESDPAYVEALQDLASATRRIGLVAHWDAVRALDESWGLAFVDCEREARAPALRRLRDRAGIIVVHDTQLAAYYGLAEIIPTFAHVVRCAWFPQETTVLSMTDPLTSLRALVEAPAP